MSNMVQFILKDPASNIMSDVTNVFSLLGSLWPGLTLASSCSSNMLSPALE